MKVVVIGANGFLGRRLVAQCISKSWDVTCVYHTKRDHIPSGCRSYSYKQMGTMKGTYDAVFLLAAMIPYGAFDHPSRQLIESNIELPLTVIKKLKTAKIIYASSTAVYGKPKKILNESSAFDNPNYYGCTKIAGETIIRFHPGYQIIRFSSIYGRQMYPKTFLPTIIREAIRLKRITLFGDGTRLQDYIHRDDAVGYLMAAAIRTKPGVYLGVNGSSYSNTDVAKLVQRFIPGCSIRYVTDDDSPSFCYNNDLTRRLLGFKSGITLENGIEDYIAYE